ncbi:hypothetical protein PC128_g7990 [Phytophthora cactorum]|nr:hypothetical protein PC128_g7990 [Phytophthora cactorum]
MYSLMISGISTCGLMQFEGTTTHDVDAGFDITVDGSIGSIRAICSIMTLGETTPTTLVFSTLLFLCPRISSLKNSSISDATDAWSMLEFVDFFWSWFDFDGFGSPLLGIRFSRVATSRRALRYLVPA